MAGRTNLLIFVVAASVFVMGTRAGAQAPRGRTATVVSPAPAYLYPDANREPLRILEAGTVVRVREQQGGWVEIEFNDPQWGRRIGWVDLSRLQISPERPAEPAPPRARPAPPAPPPPPPPPKRSYPAFDGALGWAFLHTEDGFNSRLGVDGAASANLTPWFGLVFDGGFSRMSGNAGGTIDWNERFYHALGGGRFSLRWFRGVVPYAQALVGYGRTDITMLGARTPHSYLVIQPGGGVEIGAGRLATKLEASWSRWSNAAGPWHQFRFVAGVVFRSDFSTTR